MRKILSALLVLASVQAAHAEDLEQLLNTSDAPVAAKAAAPAQKGLEAIAAKAMARKGPDQQAFLRAVETQNWEQAVLLFTKAYEQSSVANSSFGRALFGFLQFKAGLTVTGVETLFSAQNPNEIGELEQYWRNAIPETHIVWQLARIKWTAPWTKVFNKNIEYLVKLNAVETLNQVSTLEQIAKEAPADSFAAARAQWNLVLAYSLQDKADLAAKLLAKLMNNKKSPAHQDLMKLTAARLLFQNGYFDASIRYYGQVDKASEYWVEAQEEMSWGHIRKGQPQNAIAITKGLMTPAFQSQLRAETYLVGSLASLKVCDYTEVAQTLEQFPKGFKDRTRELEAIVDGKPTPAFTTVFEQLKNGKMSAKDFGKTANQLPRLTPRDEKIYRQAQAVKAFEAETKVADKLYALSIAATGLQGTFKSMALALKTRTAAAQAAAQNRIKDLARDEVAETKDVLRKLHIVEAEMVQQVMVASKSNTKTAPEIKSGTTGAKGADTVTFPADNEIWFDEIGQYKVDVKKACLNQGTKVIK